jgi:hypothetical protein
MRGAQQKISFPKQSLETYVFQALFHHFAALDCRDVQMEELFLSWKWVALISNLLEVSLEMRQCP